MKNISIEFRPQSVAALQVTVAREIEYCQARCHDWINSLTTMPDTETANHAYAFSWSQETLEHAAKLEELRKLDNYLDGFNPPQQEEALHAYTESLMYNLLTANPICSNSTSVMKNEMNKQRLQAMAFVFKLIVDTQQFV